MIDQAGAKALSLAPSQPDARNTKTVSSNTSGLSHPLAMPSSPPTITICGHDFLPVESMVDLGYGIGDIST